MEFQLNDSNNDLNTGSSLDLNLPYFKDEEEQLFNNNLNVNEYLAYERFLQDYNYLNSESILTNLNTNNFQDNTNLILENQMLNNSCLLSINCQSLNNFKYQYNSTKNLVNKHEAKEPEFEEDNSIFKDIGLEDKANKNYCYESKECKERLFFDKNKQNLSTFPYLENDYNNALIPNSNFSCANRQIVMTDSSALTLVNFQGNLIAYRTDNLFLL